MARLEILLVSRLPVFTVLDSVWRSVGADLCRTRLPDPSTSIEMTLEDAAEAAGAGQGRPCQRGVAARANARHARSDP